VTSTTLPSCTGKFPFPTRELAEASAVRMRKRKSQHQAAQTYRCHHCGKWHIGGSRPAYVVHSTQNFKRRRREAGEEAGVEE
jgi:hypothetical protein